jgi:hypothetical protein
LVELQEVFDGVWLEVVAFVGWGLTRKQLTPDGQGKEDWLA